MKNIDVSRKEIRVEGGVALDSFSNIPGDSVKNHENVFFMFLIFLMFLMSFAVFCYFYVLPATVFQTVVMHT